MTRHSVDRVERFVSNALGTCAAAESLSLTAISSRAIVNIDSAASTVCGGGAHLRALELRVPLCLAIAEALLPQLPHLRRLCLPYVATELSLLPPLPTKSSRVFSRSLQFLSMGFWDCRQDLCAMSRAVVGFVSAIPSLLTLVHDAHVAAGVRRLIACNTTITATTTAADHLHKLMITDHTKLSY
ncbi:hypothetical protein IWW47_006083 [Coemansia sp. RSA 2052]|nr:hypothetical protein IWW47_006083 [Coemansia sp. RSA 2052]